VKDRNPDSVIYRELGQFCLDGYIRFLGRFDNDSLDYRVPPGSYIRGYSAYSELNTSDADKVIGLVCHHWIMDAFGDTLVVYPDDMRRVFPNLKFIVAGHDHAYHPSYMARDGVMVVRPGSMMRTDAGKASDRIPLVNLVTVEEGASGVLRFTWDEVPIACARPYSEVFYTEKRDINAESVNALSRFVRQMQDHSTAVMDIQSAVREQLALVPAADQGMVKADLASNGFMI